MNAKANTSAFHHGGCPGIQMRSALGHAYRIRRTQLLACAGISLIWKVGTICFVKSTSNA